MESSLLTQMSGKKVSSHGLPGPSSFWFRLLGPSLPGLRSLSPIASLSAVSSAPIALYLRYSCVESINTKGYLWDSKACVEPTFSSLFS